MKPLDTNWDTVTMSLRANERDSLWRGTTARCFHADRQMFYFMKPDDNNLLVMVAYMFMLIIVISRSWV